MPFERQYNGKKVRECIQKYEHFKSFRKVEKITGVGKSTINRWYIRFSKLAYGFTNGKVTCNRQSESFKLRESEFQNVFRNVNFNEVVCIDETGFCNIGNSVYGYFTKGKQPLENTSTKRERRSVAMAVCNDTLVHSKIQLQAFNSATFLDFITTIIPTFPLSVKYILLDNVSFHRSNCIKEFVKSKGLKFLFIPPYSRCRSMLPVEGQDSSLRDSLTLNPRTCPDLQGKARQGKGKSKSSGGGRATHNTIQSRRCFQI
jgi:hypothetical protein